MTKTNEELIQKKDELLKIHEESRKVVDAALDAYTQSQEQANVSLRDNEYTLDVTDRVTYKQLLDYLYKDAPWNYASCAQLMLLVSNIELNNSLTTNPEFDGKIKLRGMYALNLTRMLREGITGSGFNSARRFAKMMSILDNGLTEIAKQIQELFKPVDEAQKAHQDAQTKYYTEEQEIRNIDDELATRTSDAELGKQL